MLLSVQHFEILELGVRRKLWAVYARGLWVNVLALRGMGQNETLVPALGFGRPSDTRSSVGVALEGRCVVRYGDRSRECDAGSLALFPGRASFRSAVAADTDPTVSMHIEMDRTLHVAPPSRPSFDRVRSLGRIQAAVHALTQAIELAWEDRRATTLVDQALGDVFSMLRAEGMSLPTSEAWQDSGLAPPIHRLGKAVDLAVSQIDARATLSDVERFGRSSARTIERAFPELCEAWGQRPESFREYAQRSLLVRACGAMVNPLATTERVARAMGFSSPNAFCRAVARAGLPTPGNIRRIAHDYA